MIVTVVGITAMVWLHCYQFCVNSHVDNVELRGPWVLVRLLRCFSDD